MYAMRIHAPARIESAPLVYEEVSAPVPEPDELLVRVKACAICRTDLHVIEGDLPFRGKPLTPGHQVTGIVEQADAAGLFRAGERVGIAWLREVCGVCPFCRAGKENLCERARFTGYHEDGGFAEFARVKAAFAYRIPAAFADEEATPLLCAGIIGFRALRRSEIRPGGRLGLYGFGSSAHIALQIAKAWGCEVFVATRGERHRRFAQELGADWVGDARDPFPQPADASIIFAPAGDLVPVALQSLQKGGTVALAGIYMSDVPAMAYEPNLFYEKNLRSVTANTREDGRLLFEEAAKAGVKPQVTLFPLREANRALQQLKADALNGTGVLQIG